MKQIILRQKKLGLFLADLMMFMLTMFTLVLLGVILHYPSLWKMTILF